jgi:flagellar basal-body rod protein FlgF
MENMLLVGLSRQMTLERQMDVVANNVANVNTNGYKADRSLFQEYLNSGAHEDNFKGRDRAVSYVLDNGTFKDFTQGASEQTKNPLDVAIDGGGFLVVQTPAGERYTRDGGLQINNQGQLVTLSGDPVLGTSGPIVFQPTDHDITIAADGNVTVVEGVGHTDSVRGKLRLVSFAQAQRLLKRRRRTAARHQVAGAAGFCRKVQRQLGGRDEPHDRSDARLHPDRHDAADPERSAQIRDRKTRRRPGIAPPSCE